ncbi:hypothetical protein N5D52_14850 [Pseudomonas sp. GD03860]|uniref:hypothetical protein n=1 Tax=Pseudomonas sp. GD03860 TaxID=2975389 RepID=UPI002448393B|nr:hypothetical protein [Pseudomonas sp. GD03860]MDH0638224.1 hypothetical protein [Pseudomonas sp. GD03860]
MHREERDKALAAWRVLFSVPEIRMDAAEQYDELVSMADRLQHQGLIDAEDRNALILEATERYASSIEGLGEGT